MTSLANRRGRCLLLALALGLAACAAPSQLLPQPPPPMVQELVFRVLDREDRPLDGASLEVTPLQGRPRDPGPYRANPQGLIALPWNTLALDQRAGKKTRDQVFVLRTSLDYTVEAPGYLPLQGHFQAEGHYRQLARPELKGIDIPAALAKRVVTLVLHRLEDLLGPGLAQRPAGDPLAKACLEFYEKNHAVAKSLGTEFAWPSCLAQGGLLHLRLEWKGAAWSALGQVPLPGQVSLSAGLPLAILLGEDLLPAPGVQQVSLEIFSEISPDDVDPYAAPVQAWVVLAGPAADFQDLAAGRVTPDQFLAKHPPHLEREDALAVTHFGGDKQ